MNKAEFFMCIVSFFASISNYQIEVDSKLPKRTQKINFLSPEKILTYGFIMIIVIGTFLLSLPLSSKDGQRLNLVDAFFTATSASTVTGLAVVDTGTHFSLFGQIVVLILTQVGGIGFMTMGTMIAFAFTRRLSLRDRLVLKQAMNHDSLEGLFPLLKSVILYSFVIESIGALLLAFRWTFDMPIGQAIYFGIFHSISIFNNAGFELFGMINGPFTGFTAFTSDLFVNVVVMILIILGGLGFIVISEIIKYPYHKQLSLHSKVVLTTSGFLIVAGALLIFVMERSNTSTLQPMPVSNQLLTSFFHSISSRSGGVSTVSIAEMNNSTQFLLVLLMFIGAAPGSTGGGIKVTVFATLLGALYAMIRGRQDIVMFRRRLPMESILKAVTLTWLSLLLVIFASMILSVLEDRQFLPLLFETTSAFATAGLSLDLTPRLTDIGKIIISIVMFLGRLGPLTLAYAIRPKSEKELYRYPEGKITIG